MLSSAASKDPAMCGQLDYEIRDHQFYPTPPENVNCLAHFIPLYEQIVWEPACGEGHISKRLRRLGAKGVVSTDLIDRGYGTGGIDFLKAGRMPNRVTAIITNPPFDDLAEQFVRRALELTKPVDGMVAMFLRNEWDCAVSRDDLFEGHPAWHKKIIVQKRPRWIVGSKGSPRHSYSWFVWDHRSAGDPATVHYVHPKTAVPLVAPPTIQ